MDVLKVFVQLANHASLMIAFVLIVNRLSVKISHWPALCRKLFIGTFFGFTLLTVLFGWSFIRPSSSIWGIMQTGIFAALGWVIMKRWIRVARHEDRRPSNGRHRDTLTISAEEQADVPSSTCLSEELKGALDRGELYLHYQPQFTTESRQIRGFEALLRWRHPKLGIIPPDIFIPIAEETGLILRIGRWVLREACTRHRLLREEGFSQSVMCVNISAVQLQETSFAEEVIHLLKETGHPPEQLELEITESMLICSWETALHVLNRLHSHRVRIALDDFGTGYSSLSYLRRLPIHLVKLDRSFVQDMIHSSREKALVESIVLLARSVGIDVLAEGIETEEQFRCLQSMSCACVQGYLLGRPMDGETLWDYMQRYREEQRAVLM